MIADILLVFGTAAAAVYLISIERRVTRRMTALEASRGGALDSTGSEGHEQGLLLAETDARLADALDRIAALEEARRDVPTGADRASHAHLATMDELSDRVEEAIAYCQALEGWATSTLEARADDIANTAGERTKAIVEAQLANIERRAADADVRIAQIRGDVMAEIGARVEQLEAKTSEPGNAVPDQVLTRFDAEATEQKQRLAALQERLEMVLDRVDASDTRLDGLDEQTKSLATIAARAPQVSTGLGGKPLTGRAVSGAGDDGTLAASIAEDHPARRTAELLSQSGTAGPQLVRKDTKPVRRSRHSADIIETNPEAGKTAARPRRKAPTRNADPDTHLAARQDHQSTYGPASPFDDLDMPTDRVRDMKGVVLMSGRAPRPEPHQPQHGLERRLGGGGGA